MTAVSDMVQGSESGLVKGAPYGPPSAAKDLRAESGQKRVSLTWTEVLEDGGRPVTKYVIYRGLDKESLDVLLEVDPSIDGPSMTYTDQAVEEEVEYWYAVAARNLAGVGARSELIRATPLVVPKPPTVPLEISVKQDGAKVILSWKSPADIGTSDITSYVIFKGEDPEDLILIGQVSGDVLEYVDDEGLKKGGTYYYSVLAENQAGKSPMSQEVKLDFKDTSSGTPSFTLAMVMIAWLVSILLTRIKGGRGR